MNKFLEKYKEEREAGSNEFEALGIAAMHIAINGTFKDLEIVYDYHHQDFMEETKREFEAHERYINQNLTSYERNLKESGMKESDFR